MATKTLCSADDMNHSAIAMVATPAHPAQHRAAAQHENGQSLKELGEAYSTAVEAQLRAQDLDGAIRLLAEARDKAGPANFGVISAAHESVLRSAVQAQQHARAVDLLRDMCAAGTDLSDATFNHMLDGAVRSRSFGEAWDILELLLTQGRKADKYFVSILTKSLESTSDRRCVRRGIGLVDRFIEQQREDVDEIVFNSLLNVLGHVGDMLKLQQTVEKMKSYGVPPSAVTYGTIVKAYGRASDIDAVLKVWHEMRERCLGVNPVTCGCVLDACVKCGHIDKAMAIFQEMRLHGLHKNTVLYATLIKGLAKVRDLAGAVHLYQEMRMENVPCNLVAFNSLMDVCVRCGDQQMAAVFLQDMMQLGIEPDLITFSTLIKGYCHLGEVRKALALKEELVSRGLRCDEIMYNSLIDGCSKAHQLEEGIKVFHDMLQSNVPPSNITFSILVKLYFDHGRMDEAFHLIQEMSTVYRCAPSRVVYSVLLRCCAQFGGAALGRGAAMLAEMGNKRNSKLPDQGMVGTMLTACVQHGDLETAMQLAREFGCGKNRHVGSAPLDSLCSLFQALAVRGEAARGHELLEFLRKRGLASTHIAQLRQSLNGSHVTLQGYNNGHQSAQYYNQGYNQSYDQYNWQNEYQDWNATSEWYPPQSPYAYQQPPTMQDFYMAAMHLDAPGCQPVPGTIEGSYAQPPYQASVPLTPSHLPPAQLPQSLAPQAIPPPPPAGSAVPVKPPCTPAEPLSNKENVVNAPEIMESKGAKVPPGLLENANNSQVHV